MTYDEREKQLCNNCEAKENCSYMSRNLERKCSFRETTMYGWKLGYKDAIDKACEWLFEYNKHQAKKFGAKSIMRLSDYTIYVGDFRKAMEEQQ